MPAAGRPWSPRASSTGSASRPTAANSSSRGRRSPSRYSGDLFRVGVGGGGPAALTHDHRSISPLWSPDGRIVFDKARNLKSPVGPEELYSIDRSGGTVRQLTHTKVAPLLFGLSPVDFSANGRRLLAEFGGQDTSYAVAVDPRTGAERKVIPGDMEMGFFGTAIPGTASSCLARTASKAGPDSESKSCPTGAASGR